MSRPFAPRWPLLAAMVFLLGSAASIAVLLGPDPDTTGDDDEDAAALLRGSSQEPMALARAVPIVADEPTRAEGADVLGPAPNLRLPGRLPRLRDPRRALADRFESEQQALREAARVEAMRISERMAHDLEGFVASLRPLPRAEQRRHARAVEHHFDWPTADRLAVLRQQLPQADRYALQEVVYERIKPLVYELDAMAASD
ncbi:MAG: hypothetical protein RIT45_414 [Pseudomonadota bacterium]